MDHAEPSCDPACHVRVRFRAQKSADPRRGGSALRFFQNASCRPSRKLSRRGIFRIMDLGSLRPAAHFRKNAIHEECPRRETTPIPFSRSRRSRRPAGIVQPEACCDRHQGCPAAVDDLFCSGRIIVFPRRAVHHGSCLLLKRAKSLGP